MKHRVEELEGALLDAAVAKAEGWFIDEPDMVYNLPIETIYASMKSPAYSWTDGGPIIERERIQLLTLEPQHVYSALCRNAVEDGRTPLIAAMRAYCASKFGEEVELP